MTVALHGKDDIRTATYIKPSYTSDVHSKLPCHSDGLDLKSSS